MNHEELMINYSLHASLGTALPLKAARSPPPHFQHSQQQQPPPAATPPLPQIRHCTARCGTTGGPAGGARERLHRACSAPGTGCSCAGTPAPSPPSPRRVARGWGRAECASSRGYCSLRAPAEALVMPPRNTCSRGHTPCPRPPHHQPHTMALQGPIPYPDHLTCPVCPCAGARSPARAPATG